VKTLFQRPDRINDPLYVVTMISNPARYRVRWKHFEDFAKRCEEAGAILYPVEVAFGERAFVIDHPNVIQLRTSHELWHKENAINLGIQRLPQDWKYVACIDADITFARPDWANETIHQLQHYSVVQMWSQAQDLDPEHQALVEQRLSLAYCWMHGLPRRVNHTKGDYYGYETTVSGQGFYWHPGYAWAYRRDAIDGFGGLLDVCMLGGADYHMAYGLIGEIEQTIQRKTLTNYNDIIRRWADRADRTVKRSVGYVPGLILHSWHGAKAHRRYRDRWSIFEQVQYDPYADLKHDWQGLWQLTDRSPEFRHMLSAYFRQRNEDSVDVDPRWAATMLNAPGKQQ
jgi:hypothetical protein